MRILRVYEGAISLRLREPSALKDSQEFSEHSDVLFIWRNLNWVVTIEHGLRLEANEDVSLFPIVGCCLDTFVSFNGECGSRIWVCVVAQLSKHEIGRAHV